jgi:hypothetical protein
LAGAFLAGAFLATAFLAGFFAVGINIPPFSPHLREIGCEKNVNNSLAAVNKFRARARQLFFCFDFVFLKKNFRGAGSVPLSVVTERRVAAAC